VIPIDSSIWIDHLRRTIPLLTQMLADGAVLAHPFVIGELALGSIHNRETVIAMLSVLPCAKVALNPEVLHLVERFSLAGRGIGYVDAHLLASVRLSPGTELWTRDRRLNAIALEMGLAMTRTHS